MRSILIVFFVHFGLTSSAQVRVVNLSLTDSSLNYFYIGVENEVEVNWKGVSPDRIWVTINDGFDGSSITQIGKNRYIVKVTYTTDSCLLQIHLHGNVMIQNSYFKCRPLNNVIARLGNIEDSIATVNKILINPLIVALSPDSYYRVDFRIREFSADFIHEGDTTFTHSSGNLLNDAQKKLVKAAIPGDHLYFHHIVGFYPGGRAISLPPFRLYIR